MASLADHLSARQIGQANSRGGQDSITLHVNPREAKRVVPILLSMGGSGRHDPDTDGWHFDDENGDGGTSENASGSYSESDMSSANASAQSEVDAAASEWGGIQGDGWSFGGPGAWGGFDTSEALQSSYSSGIGPDGKAYEGFLDGPLGIGRTTITQDIQDQQDAIAAANFVGPTTKGASPGQLADFAFAANPNFITGTQQFMANHPTLVSTINGLVGLANPFAGMALNTASGFASGRGGQTLGGLAGSVFGGPAYGLAGSLLGSLADGKSGAQVGQAALASGLSAGFNSLTQGGLGRAGFDALGQLGGQYGSQFQGMGAGALANGITSSLNTGYDGSGSTGGDSGGGSYDDATVGSSNTGAGPSGNAYGPSANQTAYTQGRAAPSAPSLSGYLPTSFQQTPAAYVPTEISSSGAAVPISIASRNSDYAPPIRLSELLRQGDSSAS